MNSETFFRDGIIFPAGWIDVSGFSGKYYQFQADSKRLRGKDTFLKPHLASAWLDNIVRDPEIVDKVEQIIGPNIVLWESDWSVKRAGTGDYVPWHQDSPYWNLSSNEVVSVWIAIGEVTSENGAMQVVPGSHKQGRIGSVDAEGNLYNAYTQGQRTTDEDCMFPFAHLKGAYEAQAIYVELKPGQFSIHSVDLIHGGGPNFSNHDRIGLALRYISADTRYLGNVDSVTPIRGDCERDYFVFEPRADGEFTDAGLAALEHALTFPSGFGEAKRTR